MEMIVTEFTWTRQLFNDKIIFMIPANNIYPEFVPDQLLTSSDLNNLFGYLDEQERLTRTNLIGVGIVCGLEVKINAAKTAITITKGTGVTTEGYLVVMEEVTYTKYSQFDAVKDELYDRFVNIDGDAGHVPPILPRTQKFNLWELNQASETTATDLITESFLSDKAVLVFVELLEEDNKNCNPNSCDDKGKNVTVTFRPLLVEKNNAAALLSGTGSGTGLWLALPEIGMKRFNVPATALFECLNIFESYQKILTSSFLTTIQSALSGAYNAFRPLFADMYPTDPFLSLAVNHKFLYDGTITPSQLQVIQYYYDQFSDILLAYDEFKEAGIEITGSCCPDNNFPRHLMLDLAIPDTSTATSSYRHYFIPSPILQGQQKAVASLKILFRKIVLLTQKFSVPPALILGSNKTLDANIRVTPSSLGNVPLSTKAIPYYYTINNASDTLLKNWDPVKLANNKFTRNLSYHAPAYTSVNEIRQPLLYDLEPYNFLRIEGHIGKPWQHVVKNILAIRNKNRLPFEVVALNADISGIIAFLKELVKLMTTSNANMQSSLESLTSSSCHFNDLEAIFDTTIAELYCKLSNEMKFFYDLKRDAKRPALTAPANNIPQAPLLKKTDPSFRFTTNTIGHEFELYYATVKDLPFIPIQVFFQSFGQGGNNDVIDFLFKAVLYYIQVLSDTFSTGLSSFGFFDFYTRYSTLIFTVRYIKFLNKFNSELWPLAEEENDHLDALLSICADNKISKLYLEFLQRILEVKVMQQIGYYAIKHPGIQHKAGVPMGGTFIVVYHEAEKVEAPPADNNRLVVLNRNVEERTEFKLSETENTREHLNILASGINERLSLTKDRMMNGLQSYFAAGKLAAEGTAAKMENTTAESNAAAPVTTNETEVSVASANAATAEQSTAQSVLSYFTDAGNYLKNRKADALDGVIEDINDGAVIADFYLPYICCSDCPPIQYVVNEAPVAPNQPPVARAGSDIGITLPANTVTLDGSTSTDAEGPIASYQWTKISGPTTFTIQSPTAAKTDVTDLAEGEYEFELKVTDSGGQSSTDTVKITVSQPDNIDPIANAGSDQVINLPTNSVSLNGSASNDPDGTIVEWKWTQKTTLPCTIVDDDKPFAIINAMQAGRYVFDLQVKDNRGGIAHDEMEVFVNRSPVANAGPDQTIRLPLNSVTLNGSATDTDGTIAAWNWTKVSTLPSAIVSPNAQQTVVTSLIAGTHTFRLTVTDDKSATGFDDVQVIVLAANQQPLAVITAPANVNTVQQQFTLDGSQSSDPDGTIVSFKWKQSAGPAQLQITNDDKAIATVGGLQTGTFSFSLEVKDNEGGTNVATHTVVITKTDVPVVSCASLENIVVTEFDKVKDLAGTQPYSDVLRYFSQIKKLKLWTLTIDEQIKFFASFKVSVTAVTGQATQMPITEALQIWLKQLADRLKENDLLSLRLFRILVQFSMYIACIQKEDINNAEVKMDAVFELVLGILKSWKSRFPNFTPEMKAEMKLLLTAMQIEKKKIEDNNENKPAYISFLDQCIEILKNV